MLTNVIANQETILATFDDGDVLLDRRLYEAKLAPLMNCETVDDAIQLFQECKKYLMEHYKTENLIEPERC